MSRLRKRFRTPDTRPGDMQGDGVSVAGSDGLATGVGLGDLGGRRLWIVVGILVLFGLVKAVAYWGAYAVPNPDFPGFVRVGEALWSGELPPSFKRGPVLGLVIVGLSRLMGDDVMRAGWLWNAVLSVANVVLVFAVARRLVPRAAPFLAILATANPMVIHLQVNPIAETTMIFFMLATVALIFYGSRWAYVAASVATMVRYECAMLIVLAFLADGLRHRTPRRWAQAFGCAVAASIPFLIWMGCTSYYWQPGESHYVRNYGHGAAIGAFLNYCWQVSFQPLLNWPGAARQELAQLLPFEQAQAMGLLLASEAEMQALDQVVAVLGWLTAAAAVTGAVLGILATMVRRHAPALVLWAFVLFYIIVHGLRAETVPRYVVPISWILIVLSVFGYAWAWQRLRDRLGVLPSVEPVIQAALLVGAVAWLAALLGYVVRYPSPRMVIGGQWVLLAGLAAVVVVGVLHLTAGRFHAIWRVGATVAVVGVLFTSYHAQAVRLVGNNTYYVEFKILMDWFREHTQPGEKLASRWAGTLEFIVPTRREDLVGTQSLAAPSLAEFIDHCRQQGVRYVTWSTRGSAATRQGLENIGPILAQPQSIGPLQFIDRIVITPDRWINVFEVIPAPGLRPRPDRRPIP